MSNIVEIPMRLPSLNEYINACKTQGYRSYYKNKHWNKGNQMKQQIQKDIEPYLKKLGVFNNGIRVNFTWIEPDKKRDLDNICFAKKFILDAMVNGGVIPDDNSRYVTGFMDNFGYDKKNPRVIVEVIENE